VTEGLDIRLLGPPIVLVDGLPLKVDTKKAIALIAILAMTPGLQSRSRLAALLWPESDEEHARSALRRTISTLNRALGGRWLEVGRDQVALALDARCSFDVERFQAVVEATGKDAIQQADDALELYRDD
jgi:DNA-binding SARP family transcriptional activator